MPVNINSSDLSYNFQNIQNNRIQTDKSDLSVIPINFENESNKNNKLITFSQNSTNKTSEIKTLRDEFEKTKKEQGTIGNLWDGFKNLTGIGDGSDKTEKAIEKYENGEISEEEAKKALEEYQDGQKTCVDVAADIVSGIVAIGAFALAVPTGGMSIAGGLALSTALGAGIKTGIKSADAKLNDREYNLNNALYDVVTGGVNGVLAPVTNGLGNTVVKTIGSKLGLEVTTNTATKSTFKNILLNQSIDVTGGIMKKRAAALGAGMAVDGSISGGIYNASASIAQGKSADEVVQAGVEGFVGGLIAAPIIGGGFRAAGKLGKTIGDNIFLSKEIKSQNIENINVQAKKETPSIEKVEDIKNVSEEVSAETQPVKLQQETTNTVSNKDEVKQASTETALLKPKLSREEIIETIQNMKTADGQNLCSAGDAFFYASSLSDAELEKMLELTLEVSKIKKGVFFISLYDMSKLAKLESEKFDRAKSLIAIPGREFQFPYHQIKFFIHLEPEEFSKLKSLLIIPGRSELSQFNFGDIQELVKLETKQFEIAKTFFNIPKKGNRQFNGYEIAALAKLEPKQLEIAETLFNVPEGRNRQFNGYEIAAFAKLEPKQLEIAETLFNIPERGNRQFKGYEIAAFSKLTPKELEKIKPAIFLQLRNLKDENIDKFIDLERYIFNIDDFSSQIDLASKILSDETIENFEKQKSIVMSNRGKYINGELDEKESIKKVNNFFKNNYNSLMISSAVFDDRTINTLLRMRFDNAKEYLNTISEFDLNDINLLSKLVQSTKKDSKILTEKEKIEFIDLISAYKQSNLSMEKIQKMADNGVVDIEELNKDLLTGILKKYGLAEEELAKIPDDSDKLTKWNLQYMHLLAGTVDDDKTAFTDLLRASVLCDFKTYIRDTSNVYGQANMTTQKMFGENGIDYDKWIRPSKENNVHFSVKDKNLEMLNEISSDIKDNMKKLTDISFKIRKKYKNNIVNDEFVIPKTITNNGITVNCQTKDGMEYFIKSVLEDLGCVKDGKLLNENEIDPKSIYSQVKNDLNNPAKSKNANDILTIIDHLKEKLQAVKNIQEIQSAKTMDWTIKMWDRIPQKDLFQGNYSTCCIGMGNFNGHYMPHYLMNTAYNMIEIKDNQTGEIVGNALCYFVKDEAGKPIFIVDNIEIHNGKILSKQAKGEGEKSSGEQLRDKITEYAANVAKEVTGSNDTPIYMSRQYNDVPIDDLEKNSMSIQNITFMGDIDADKIYMDLFGGEFTKTKLPDSTKKLPDTQVTLLRLK